MTREEFEAKFGNIWTKDFDFFDRCFNCAGDGGFADGSECEDCLGSGKQSMAERLNEMRSFK